MARNLSAQTRTATGKNENNRLREKGLIPVVMYSHGKSEILQVIKKDFASVFGKHISESVIVDLDIEGKEKCHIIVKDYQLDPVTDEILHLDFYKITAGEKIKTSVPVEYTGTPAGVRVGGVFEIVERELHVECLPSELPEKISVDVSKLGVDEAVHIKDIVAPASMKFDLEADHVVAHVTTVKEEKVEEAAPAEAAPAAPAEAKKEETAKKGK
ncbi:MAG: 50S ribosomal protein L25 [Spirochaetota bacterium]